MKIFRLYLLAALPLICLVAAGCGDSSEASPLKKPRFVREANGICSSAEAERLKAFQQASKDGGDSNQAKLLREVALPSIEKMTEELGELGAPVGDEDEVRAIINAFEEGIAKLEAGPSGLASEVEAFAKADKLSEEYGLTDCGI